MPVERQLSFTAFPGHERKKGKQKRMEEKQLHKRYRVYRKIV